MGNSESKKPYGRMNIESMAAEYFSGTLVSGVLNIEVTNDLPSNQLAIELFGIEYVNFVRLTAPYDGAAVDDSLPSKKKKKKVFYEVVQLNPNSKKFYKGNYHFPFSFQLPIKIPSSFKVKFRKGHEMCYGGINYYIRATIGKGSKKLAMERPIIIKEVYVLDNVNWNVTELRPVNANEFRVTLNKDTAISSDSLKANIHFDNSSSRDKIKKFEWKTELKLRLTAAGTTQETLLELNRGTLEGVEPNQVFDKQFLIDLSIPNKDLQNAITFSGKLINISYVVKIYAISPVLQLFKKKTKVKFSLKLFNYRPEQYVNTINQDDTNRDNITFANTNRNNVLLSNTVTVTNLNFYSNRNNRFKERATLPTNTHTPPPGREDRRFTAMPDIIGDRGFDYPEFSTSPKKRNIDVDDNKIKVYNVPLKSDLVSFKELSQIQDVSRN